MSETIPDDLAKIQNFLSISVLMKNKLFFATYPVGNIPVNSKTISFYAAAEIVNYMKPLNLATIAKYLNKVNLTLALLGPASKAVFYNTFSKDEKQTNAAFCMGVFALCCLKMSAAEAAEMVSQHTDSDTTVRFSLLRKAIDLGFVNFDDFNESNYDSLDKLNLYWIVPRTVLELPTGLDHYVTGRKLSPKHYIKYFRGMGVNTVVRMCHIRNTANPFVNAEFCHYDLSMESFKPTEDILRCFIEICEKSAGPVVVQDRANEGRSGCLIGAYLVKHYRLTADEADMWLRFCGSCNIIESQLAWLKKKETSLHISGDDFRLLTFRAEDRIPHHEVGIHSYSFPENRIEGENIGSTSNERGPDCLQELGPQSVKAIN